MLNETLKSIPVAGDGSDDVNQTEYVAPAIERMLTPADMEREIHYAGGLTCPTCDRNNFT